MKNYQSPGCRSERIKRANARARLCAKYGMQNTHEATLMWLKDFTTRTSAAIAAKKAGLTNPNL